MPDLFFTERKMLFSIVVPVYGIEKYLSKCIDSILAQSYTDFELILVDDGSKDASGKICDQYKEKDRRIKVIHKENGGLVSARKAGLQEADGDYIIPIDGDDWVDTELFAAMAELLIQYPGLDLICYGMYQGVNDGRYLSKPVPECEGLYDVDKIKISIFPHLIKGDNGVRFPPNVWGKVFSRQLYQAYQLAVPNSIALGEDAAVTYPLVSQTKSMFITKQCFYYYRMNPNSMTKSRKKGFDWENLRTLADIWHHNLNPAYDFSAQIARYMCHDLFNVAKSHLQTNQPYAQVKQMILQEINTADFQTYINDAHFTRFSKEQIPKFLLRYQLIFLIKILSKYI